MKKTEKINPFEIVVVKMVDELGLPYSFNVWLSDLPRFMREIAKNLDSTPLESVKVLFGVDPVKGSDGFFEPTWVRFY